MTVDTPAVVLGAGANGLGVARSLARAGVPVCLLDADTRRAEMRTRAAKPLQIGATYGETLVEDLVRLGTTQFSGMRPVLFLTQEESVKTVSHHRDRLSALYRFSLPPMEVVDTLLHKEGFQRRAEQLGSPVPPLVHIRALADLPALGELRYPVVVKPGERDAAYARRFKKAYRAGSAAEAAALLRRILLVMADVVVQEWIEGPDSNIYFCLQYVDRYGQLAGSFAGRKIRSWPPQVGGTASFVAAPEVHAELSAMTTRFFSGRGRGRHGQHGVQARHAQRRVPHGGADHRPYRLPGRGGNLERRQSAVRGLVFGAGPAASAACRYQATSRMAGALRGRAVRGRPGSAHHRWLSARWPGGRCGMPVA
jgi:predicted ATP-grasp superfamily ATP-dependent carboligase